MSASPTRPPNCVLCGNNLGMHHTEECPYPQFVEESHCYPDVVKRYRAAKPEAVHE